MNFIKLRFHFVKFFLLAIAIFFSRNSFSQLFDSTKKTGHLGGSIELTNNGISVVPTFSLNKPAAIFKASAGKGRLSFDPEFSCSFQGKPWNFFIWLRYQLIQKQKFSFNVAVHPDFSFFSQTLSDNGVVQNYTTVQRYLSFDFAPNYSLTKKTSIGIFYLLSKGLSDISVKTGNFLTCHINFSGIKFFKDYFFSFSPQVYYLKLDEQDGYYFSSVLVLGKNNFPFTITTTNNKIIKTDITGSKNFVWNISLIYSFSKNYIEKK